MSNALDDLIAAVEGGTWSFNGWADQPIDRKHMGKVDDAYNGSLDAAKALHNAVLPGWTNNDHLRRGMRYTTFIGKSVEDEPVDAVSNDPARAWLIAILKAMKEGKAA